MIGFAGILLKAVTGSFMGRAIAIGLAALTALSLNNLYQRSAGAKKERVKIIQKTNEVAKKRDANIRKTRRNINPNTAFERLRREYAGSD